MPRKKPDPTPTTTPTHFRLTPDDLTAIDKIVAHYHLTSRVDAVRLAVHHVAANMAPLTTAPAKPLKRS